MSATTTIPGKPRGPLLWLLRLPILLYRLRLGWVLGHRFLMFTHRGRKSGRIRRTVLEVVHYDRATHESIVARGFGARTDWWLNILASPTLEVHIGLQRCVPQQRFLTVDEGYTVLAAYEQRHRRLARLGFRLLWGYDGTDAGLHALAQTPPMVAFRPTPHPWPPPLMPRQRSPRGYFAIQRVIR